VLPRRKPQKRSEDVLNLTNADVAAQSRRNILLLAIAQSLYSCCVITIFATAALVGLNIAPSPAEATWPITTFVLGSMFTTIPASLVMQRIGRKPVFIAGALVSIIGSLVCVWAIFNGNFKVFCLGTMLQGVFQATSHFYRFAAAESADEKSKAIAISWVLMGGVVAAVGGTMIADATSELFKNFVFAGSYMAMIGFALANIVAVSLLRLPDVKATVTGGEARPWSVLLAQPKLVSAMLAAMMSYALMNLLMTAAPVAMVQYCGFNKTDAKWVIQWHVLAMFVPSFFTGQLIKKFGAAPVTAAGLALLMSAGLAGLAGISFVHFAVALMLLGLGWNFGFIGATTMLTDCYRPSERGKVQAANDFGIALLMAIASKSSGDLLFHFGWDFVATAVLPPAALALALVGWMIMRRPLAELKSL
jgi:MFS family permease